MSSLRSVWALLRSKVQNEGKQYGSWRHKLKQECLCFDKLNMTEDAVGGFANSLIRGFAYLLIRLAGLRAKDGSPLGGKSNGRSYGAIKRKFADAGRGLATTVFNHYT